MAKPAKRKVHTVCVTIRWCDDEVVAEDEHGSGIPATLAQSQQHIERSIGYNEALHNVSKLSASLPSKRLLPSDRVVLNALRARVPQGKQITSQVRVRELEAECEISRRQVQICVKRLIEKGLIKRVIEDTNLGNASGNRYHLSKDVLSE